MAQERSQLNIPVATPYGKTTLHIVPVSKGKLYEADSADISNGLQQFQLVEGNTYQYQLTLCPAVLSKLLKRMNL